MGRKTGSSSKSGFSSSNGSHRKAEREVFTNDEVHHDSLQQDVTFMSRFKSFLKGKPGESLSVMGQTVRDSDSVYFDVARSRKRANPYKIPWAMGEGRLKVSIIVGFVSYLFLGLLYGFVIMLIFKYSPNLFYAWKVGKFVNLTLSSIIWTYTKMLTILSGVGFGVAIYIVLNIQRKRLEAAHGTGDLLDFEGDSYLLTVDELVSRYRAVPDIGAHFKGVDVSIPVAHLVLNNDGINDVVAPVLELKGNKMLPKRDAQGKMIMKKQPLFDEKGGLEELEVLGIRDKAFLKSYSPKRLIIDSRTHETMADYINRNFYLPSYETERPKGVYLADTSATNSMIVAMTRGNKGQTVINPLIDLLSRQEVLTNAFINDPKGELYSLFFETLKIRKYDTVVFNLLDSKFTDQYNPLAPAVMYSRKGYKDEPQKAVTVLADNFFPIPTGGGSDPFWTRAEQRLFSALTFLLIDMYYEEEQLYLHKYSGLYSQSVIARDLDTLWSNVTLANVYRLVSSLGTKMFEKPELHVGDGVEPTVLGSEDSNMLTVLMELTAALPTSNIRRLFSGPYGELRSMEDSEKMRASIYGLTLTEMSFFTQGPVMDLTNVSPRRSFDLISMSFPRRFSFKFNESLVDEYGYVGVAVEFELYEDADLTRRMEGRDFEHFTRIDELCWVEMRFRGIIEQDFAYVKIRLRPRGKSSNIVYAEYYAKFEKGYLSTPDGRHFSKNSVTGEFQVRDGILIPCSLVNKVVDGKVQKYENGKVIKTLSTERPTVVLSTGATVPVFALTEVSYREYPIFAFSVTPPSSTVYVKIVLMIIHSLFNASVENSYLTKDDGKPIMSTKYILDELGNLVYDGSGIKDMTTKLSIGLAQGQQFVMVFQTMQQITDTYGSTADRTIASNTGVTIFLLSNDLDALEAFSKQAGMHHVERKNNRSNTAKVGAFMTTYEDSVSITTGVAEEPLLSVQRLGKMTNGEALVLSPIKRAGNDGGNVRQNPIFNTKETSLPMSYHLHRYGYMQRKHSMLTVPTENSVYTSKDSIPPYEQLLLRRARQVAYMKYAESVYKEVHNLSDLAFEEERALFPDKTGRQLMLIVNRLIDRLDGDNWVISDSELDIAKYDERFNKAFEKQLNIARVEGISGADDTVKDVVGDVLDETGTALKASTSDKRTVQTRDDRNKRRNSIMTKKIGQGKGFTLADIGSVDSDENIVINGPFKTALVRALGHNSLKKLRRNIESSSIQNWQIKTVGTTGGSIIYVSPSKGPMLFAEYNTYVQDQNFVNESLTDGIAPNMSRQVKTQEWSLKLRDSDLWDVLSNLKNWDGLFGEGFSDNVRRYFDEQIGSNQQR